MFSRTFYWHFKLARSLQHIRCAGTAASNANPYPFPAARNPTPHQIFHLPQNASKGDIKARYYDLVRIYHPDKADLSLSSEAAHARFQSITHAYDVLQGKKHASDSPFYYSSTTPQQQYRYPTTAAWRAASRRQELYAGKDERWKDRIILFGLVATVAILVAQVFSARRQARHEALARTRHSDASQKQQTAINVSSLDASNSDRRLGE